MKDYTPSQKIMNDLVMRREYLTKEIPVLKKQLKAGDRNRFWEMENELKSIHWFDGEGNYDFRG
jgi:hypothetical protein